MIEEIKMYKGMQAELIYKATEQSETNSFLIILKFREEKRKP